ncbi:MAG: 2-isopropylmalate synthase [Alphaproteobacteria bacterium ADurb.BinA280]|jgi:2-isopropylmalate synthase|nr:2-isopropylmalate synthase [Xanthomonadales bacterium]MCC6504928.1 2-isopropylmalate synthase [Aquimonas sp.]OPZ13783.1 MAG: 2-isopropylmalate synthase [Alphaproteobacteria bacterium ADurb.BinA280]
MSQRIRIFDTTLRDGEQSPGCSMGPAQKLVMARALAELGVDVIETGFPASSQADRESTDQIARDVGKSVTLATLSRCAEADITACAKAMEHAHKPRIHVFISTSPLHRQFKLGLSREQVLERAVSAVSFAKRYFDDIEFSAEDAIRTEFDFLTEIFAATAAAGAQTLNVPDTVGYTTPDEIRSLFQRLRAAVPGEHLIWSTHCHNDLGLAVANSLAAIEGGARQVECTVNGIGERAGNCAVEELAMVLRVRQAYYEADTGIHSERLVPTSRLLQRLTGMMVQRNKAVVGVNAFAHEAGIHQHGMLKHRETYEIMRPEDVGWPKSELVLGRHSGRAAVSERLRALGFVFEEGEFEHVFNNFKDLTESQRVVTDKDLEELILGSSAVAGQGYRLASMKLGDLGGKARADVELSDPEGNRVTGEAESDGPVAALFEAMAAATGVSLQLESYQVHSIGMGEHARGEASLSVLFEEEELTGIGVSRDIIEASALAWLDVANRVLRRRVAGA